MNEKTTKIVFAMYVLSLVTLLQLVAWYLSINGAIFAFTSLIIGAVAGSILGFSLRAKK